MYGVGCSVSGFSLSIFGLVLQNHELTLVITIATTKAKDNKDNMGFLQIRGTFSKGPRNKDYCILGSFLGSPNIGKLPYP